MTFPPKTPQEWATWWEGFRKRNGLDKPLPAPPPDAPPPPADPRDPEAGKDDER